MAAASLKASTPIDITVKGAMAACGFEQSEIDFPKKRVSRDWNFSLQGILHDFPTSMFPRKRHVIQLVIFHSWNDVSAVIVNNKLISKKNGGFLEYDDIARSGEEFMNCSLAEYFFNIGCI